MTYLNPQTTSAPCEDFGYARRVGLTISYRPTSPGDHQVLLVPSSRNGPIPPQKLTLSGSAFTAAGAQWSSEFETVLKPPTEFADVKVGTSGSSGMLLTVHNVNGTNPLSLGFRLEGPNAEHFVIDRVRKMDGFHGGILDCAATLDGRTAQTSRSSSPATAAPSTSVWIGDSIEKASTSCLDAGANCLPRRERPYHSGDFIDRAGKLCQGGFTGHARVCG